VRHSDQTCSSGSPLCGLRTAPGTRRCGVSSRTLADRVTELDKSTAETGEPTSDGLRRKQADVLVQLAETTKLFHAADGTGFADVEINGHRKTWSIGSKGFKRFLSRGYYTKRLAARRPLTRYSRP
jgi:hypothetical protein